MFCETAITAILFYFSTITVIILWELFCVWRKATCGCKTGDSDRAAWPVCPGPLLLLLLCGVGYCGDRGWGDWNLYKWSLKPKILPLFVILIFFKLVQTKLNQFKLIWMLGSGQNRIESFRTAWMWSELVGCRSGPNL